MGLSGESSSCGFGSWKTCSRKLFRDSSSTIWPDPAAKKKTREIDQGIFYMFGIWVEENLRQGSLQRLVFNNLAGSSPQIMKEGELTREFRPNDQRGAEGMKRIAQGLVFLYLAGCGSRHVDREKKGEQRATFPKKKKSCLFFSTIVKMHLCTPTSRNFAMYMGKILTSCRPPLLSSQAGGQGHYALLTLSLAFGPLSPIMSGKEFVP